VDGQNQEEPAAAPYPNLDNKKPVAYVYDETGPTAYLLRTIQRSRHNSNRALGQGNPDKHTERDNKKTPEGDIIVTVTEVEGVDNRATVPASIASSDNDKGKAPVGITSPSSIIHSVSPPNLDKDKDTNKEKGTTLVQTTPPTGSMLLPSKAVSFQADGSAGMTEQDIIDFAFVNSSQADVTGNGEGHAQMPTTDAPASTAQPPPTKKRGRQASDPTLRRQASTSGSQALRLDLL
jgi:hypothetical protein